jgi:hypothetical protein
MRPPAAAAALLALLCACAAPARALTWEECEAAGMRVGAVRVASADVFDLSRGDESHVVARAANLIHITTRERVIRDALLFAPGDAASAAAVSESERRLRALPWLVDASIDPVAAGPGVVDALVRTHDGWSLSLGVKYNHAGGEDTWAIALDERNLLGFGKELLVSRERDLDRYTTELAYRDPFLLGSSWRLQAAYQDLSDGRGRLALLELPYVRLASPWSAGVEASDRDQRQRVWDRGEEVYAYRARLEDVRVHASALVRLEDRTAWRAGLEYRNSQASYADLETFAPGALPPPRLDPRRFQGVVATASVSQDRYRTYWNLRSIGHTEDVNLGWEAAAAAGWMGKVFGGSADAFVAELSAQTGVAQGPKSLALVAFEGHGRLEEGGWRDALARGRLTLYGMGRSWQTLAGSLDLTAGHDLDPEHILYLGGFDGLRGYPNHWRAGEERWLLALEDRVVTPWRLLGIVQVGFVAYAEAGAMDAPAGGWTRTWADVGGGLRFGNLKGTVARVVEITVAVPLVRDEGVAPVQIVAGNTLRF